MRLFDSWIALFDLLWLYQGMSFGFGISLDLTTIVLASAGTILPFAPADCKNFFWGYHQTRKSYTTARSRDSR